ncbi:MAG: hypothetical protein ACSLE1_12235 [Sphingobium sp.]
MIMPCVVMKWLCVDLWCLLWRVLLWVLGFGIKTPYSPTKEGYSAFVALAGFAVAQGVALTAVAKGEDRERIVICIYVVMVLLTLAWTSFMLRRRRAEAIGTPAKYRVRRAFDRPSTQFGRWTFGWISMIGIIMFLLGANKLLPNQKYRESFTAKDIPASVMYLNEKLAKSKTMSPNQESFDNWISWIKKAYPNNDNSTERIIWIEQNVAFDKSHDSFALDLSYKSVSFDIESRVAFLVTPDSTSSKPMYRQIKFRTDNEGRVSNTLDVTEPNSREYVAIMLVLQGKGGTVVPMDMSPFEFKLLASK